MVSFVTRTDEVQGGGIGDQRIISQQQPSIAAAVQQSGAALNQAVDLAGTQIAKSTAQDIVRDAQSQIEQERAEMEDLGIEDTTGAVAELNQGVKTLEKGVKSRKISRENARIRATDLVTKAIQEQPLFKDKIRRSAESLLGFSLESEASKQFFSSFETQASMGSGGGLTGMTSMEKEALGLSRLLGISLPKAMETVGQSKLLELQSENATNRMKLGDLSAEGGFRELTNVDSVQSTNRIFADVLAMKDAGEEVNENVWRQALDVQQAAFLSKVRDKFTDAGITPTSAVMQRFEEETADRYNQTFEYVKNMDSNFLTKQNIERLVTAQKAYGMQALPVFTMLTNAVGERFATRALDIIDRTGGDPERLRALFKNSPALGRVMGIVSQDPNSLARGIQTAVQKLGTDESITADDAAWLDFLGSHVVPELPSPERTNVVEALQSKGLATKAASIIAKTNLSSATPQERSIYKNSWVNARAALPGIIGNKLAESRASLSDRDAVLSVTDDGFLSLRNRRMTPSGLVNTSATNHPAWDDVQKVNMYLFSTDRGWGSELGIENKKATAEAFVQAINKAQQPEEGTPASLQVRYDELKRTNPERAKLILEAAGGSIDVSNQ